MSFRLFVYYSALGGAWAAFLVWAIVKAGEAVGAFKPGSFGATVATGALLGMLVAAAVGLVGAIANATGAQRVTRVALSGLLGAAGGTAGGLVGFGLLKLAQLIGVGFLEFVAFVAGWILAGLLIGASVGVYDVASALGSKQSLGGPFRKLLNGVAGGLMGGLVGGTIFALLIGNRFLPETSRSLSLLILGGSVGLLIGLAQVVLKEAWVKVEEGFRAGRELMLSKAETTIGRAEGCDLGLFGDNTVEKLHARITLKDNRYVVEDAGTEAGTFVNDKKVTRPTALSNGDTIRVGRNVLSFGERQKRPS